MSSYIIDSNISRLSKYDSDYAYSGSPISVRNTREYYKNGNVKANIAVFTLNKPYEVIKVRNKDYYLYKDNYNNANEYLIMLHKAYQYSNNILHFYDALSNYHLVNNFTSMEKLELRDKNQIESNTSQISIINAFSKRKPLIVDSKYKYKKSFFGFLKNKKKIKSKLFENYKHDLSNYYREMKKYEEKKMKLMINNYEINKSEVIRSKKVEMISNKYAFLKKNYNEFINDLEVDKYLQFMLMEQSEQNNIYESLNVNIECYLDLKAIILDLEIPKVSRFPRIKDHRIIKKNLVAKEIEFTNKEFDDISAETIPSYILYYIKMISKFNMSNRAEKLFLNLYRGSISINNCFSVLEIDLLNIEDYSNESPSRILKKISGKSINYNISNKVLPVRKGGM